MSSTRVRAASWAAGPGSRPVHALRGRAVPAPPCPLFPPRPPPRAPQIGKRPLRWDLSVLMHKRAPRLGVRAKGPPAGAGSRPAVAGRPRGERGRTRTPSLRCEARGAGAPACLRLRKTPSAGTGKAAWQPMRSGGLAAPARRSQGPCGEPVVGAEGDKRPSAEGDERRQWQRGAGPGVRRVWPAGAGSVLSRRGLALRGWRGPSGLVLLPAACAVALLAASSTQPLGALLRGLCHPGALPSSGQLPRLAPGSPSGLSSPRPPSCGWRPSGSLPPKRVASELGLQGGSPSWPVVTGAQLSESRSTGARMNARQLPEPSRGAARASRGAARQCQFVAPGWVLWSVSGTSGPTPGLPPPPGGPALALQDDPVRPRAGICPVRADPGMPVRADPSAGARPECDGQDAGSARGRWASWRSPGQKSRCSLARPHPVVLHRQPPDPDGAVPASWDRYLRWNWSPPARRALGRPAPASTSRAQPSRRAASCGGGTRAWRSASAWGPTAPSTAAASPVTWALVTASGVGPRRARRRAPRGRRRVPARRLRTAPRLSAGLEPAPPAAARRAASAPVAACPAALCLRPTSPGGRGSCGAWGRPGLSRARRANRPGVTRGRPEGSGESRQTGGFWRGRAGPAGSGSQAAPRPRGQLRGEWRQGPDSGAHRSRFVRLSLLRVGLAISSPRGRASRSLPVPAPACAAQKQKRPRGTVLLPKQEAGAPFSSALPSHSPQRLAVPGLPGLPGLLGLLGLLGLPELLVLPWLLVLLVLPGLPELLGLPVLLGLLGLPELLGLPPGFTSSRGEGSPARPGLAPAPARGLGKSLSRGLEPSACVLALKPGQPTSAHVLRAPSPASAPATLLGPRGCRGPAFGCGSRVPRQEPSWGALGSSAPSGACPPPCPRRCPLWGAARDGILDTAASLPGGRGALAGLSLSTAVALIALPAPEAGSPGLMGHFDVLLCPASSRDKDSGRRACPRESDSGLRCVFCVTMRRPSAGTLPCSSFQKMPSARPDGRGLRGPRGSAEVAVLRSRHKGPLWSQCHGSSPGTEGSPLPGQPQPLCTSASEKPREAPPMPGMPTTLGLALLALICAVGRSWASGFTETGLSLLGFQLCDHTETRRVQRLQAVQAPHRTYVPCGGWIPWRRCPKTVYRTRHLAVGVPEARNVTGCCEGFEQLGLYCVLRFVRRPWRRQRRRRPAALPRPQARSVAGGQETPPHPSRALSFPQPPGHSAGGSGSPASSTRSPWATAAARSTGLPGAVPAHAAWGRRLCGDQALRAALPGLPAVARARRASTHAPLGTDTGLLSAASTGPAASSLLPPLPPPGSPVCVTAQRGPPPRSFGGLLTAVVAGDAGRRGHRVCRGETALSRARAGPGGAGAPPSGGTSRRARGVPGPCPGHRWPEPRAPWLGRASQACVSAGAGLLAGPLRQHVDTGGVLLEVTRVANGSVVVEFRVLVIADLDVREVAAAFLEAFRKGSLMAVVRADTFVRGTRPGLLPAPPRELLASHCTATPEDGPDRLQLTSPESVTEARRAALPEAVSGVLKSWTQTLDGGAFPSPRGCRTQPDRARGRAAAGAAPGRGAGHGGQGRSRPNSRPPQPARPPRPPARRRSTPGDHDECESGEHNCGPGTTCRNTLGSSSASAWAPPPASLRNVLENPAKPRLTRGPPGPARRLLLVGALNVLCGTETVAVAVQMRFPWQESIPESALYLGQPACNASGGNSTHVLLAAGWGECGTAVQSNLTHTVVRTTLRAGLSPEGVIHHPQILTPVHCAFQNHLLTSSGYTPGWGVHSIVEDLHGAGSFVTEMQLFVGGTPLPQNASVPASADVRVQVGLRRQQSGLAVVLAECWATPAPGARGPVSFGFINNSQARAQRRQRRASSASRGCPGPAAGGVLRLGPLRPPPAGRALTLALLPDSEPAQMPDCGRPAGGGAQSACRVCAGGTPRGPLLGTQGSAPGASWGAGGSRGVRPRTPASPSSCAVPGTHTSLIENGLSGRAQFRLRVFSFVRCAEVFLHCRLHVCLAALCPRHVVGVSRSPSGRFCPRPGDCGAVRSRVLGLGVQVPA
ncbi:Uromodulin-like 1 [Galemys pyrenaicus]|uniref:Uromodulin-like 1 n=1 Tax=Galemys pyrenaicus TaxID=202257 RepID=A0A8J6DSU8_GALPY|nr:Uromodulin-like 1 [Galemys pyrenaicus]